MSESDLTKFVESVTGDSHLRVEDDLGDGFVRLRSAEAERRQAKHDIRSTEDIIIEMLRNARDAGARTIFVATGKEGTMRRIVMIDDGDGVPEHLHELIFEPRVTSKLNSVHMDTWGIHGRGMALYSIKVNTKSARIATSAVGLGSSFVIESDTETLRERRDQSSVPLFFKDDNDVLHIRGPRNINRTVAEFAYMDRESCSVYYGSITDIAATLYSFGCATLSAASRSFCHDVDSLPVCKRLAVAATPEDFCRVAANLGLVMSTRSARRILDGEINPVDPLAETIDVALPKKSTPHSSKKAGSLESARGMKISNDDKIDFGNEVMDAYRSLAQRYYLQDDVDPDIRFNGEYLQVKIPVRKIT